MALKDKIQSDVKLLFINPEHFGSTHTWNGRPFRCVTDEETAMKRKNNNVVDISWDNNTYDIMVYVAKEDFPGRALPNEHGFFDKRPMKIMQVNEDMGMLSIVMASFDTKAVGT